MMEALRTPETSVNFNQTAQHINPEDSHLHARRRWNLRSHKVHSLLFSQYLKTVAVFLPMI
jgi:hypothetical protein